MACAWIQGGGGDGAERLDRNLGSWRWWRRGELEGVEVVSCWEEARLRWTSAKTQLGWLPSYARPRVPSTLAPAPPKPTFLPTNPKTPFPDDDDPPPRRRNIYLLGLLCFLLIFLLLTRDSHYLQKLPSFRSPPPKSVEMSVPRPEGKVK